MRSLSLYGESPGRGRWSLLVSPPHELSGYQGRVGQLKSPVSGTMRSTERTFPSSTVSRLLNCAERSLLTRGYKGSLIRRITDEAGVNVGWAATADGSPESGGRSLSEGLADIIRACIRAPHTLPKN
jgi:hypothetical protein